MAKVVKVLSSRRNSAGKSEIFLRVTVSHDKQMRVKSGVFISPERWKGGQIICPRSGKEAIEEARAAQKAIDAVCAAIVDFCMATPAAQISKETLKRVVDIALGRSSDDGGIRSAFLRYLSGGYVSASTARIVRPMGWMLFSYLAQRGHGDRFEDFGEGAVADLCQWLRGDREKHYQDDAAPDALKGARKLYSKRRLGENYISKVLSEISAFFAWAVKEGLCRKNPLRGYNGAKLVYLAPWYLTIEERDAVAALQTDDPYLTRARDIFVFQCHVGCRIVDLQALTPENFSDGWLEYQPQKTRRHGLSVRVPLSAKAREIADAYAKAPGRPLFGKVWPGLFHRNLREVLRLAGITRMVGVLDPTTQTEVRRPICEVATSHLARRTFIGNLYKKVKDPNLIGSLSGHVEGSKAFARYRAIDDDIKRELVSLIE